MDKFRFRIFSVIFFISIFFVVLLGLRFFSLKEKNVITIGAKNNTENRILAEMIALLIEKNTDLKVRKKFHLEGTFIAFQALISKSIDLYVEYTGTALLSILKKPSTHDPQKDFEILRKKFLKKYQLVWLGPFGFQNSYVLIMQRSVAESLQIHTISELVPYFKNGDLKLGLDPEFVIRDEFKQLKTCYLFNPKFIIMDQSLLYLALINQSIQVLDGDYTDGRILRFDLITLKDDKNCLPAYIAAPLIRKDILDKYPDIRTILAQLDEQITTEKMREMNEEADQTSFEMVAKNFLRSKGML